MVTFASKLPCTARWLCAAGHETGQLAPRSRKLERLFFSFEARL